MTWGSTSRWPRPESARDLPTDAGMALYRGVQEALTNVARYAQGAKACVVVGTRRM